MYGGIKTLKHNVRTTLRSRGFTIRLKMLKPRAPDFGGPQNLEVRTISSNSVVSLFWINARIFTIYH